MQETCVTMVTSGISADAFPGLADMVRPHAGAARPRRASAPRLASAPSSRRGQTLSRSCRVQRSSAQSDHDTVWLQCPA